MPTEGVNSPAFLSPRLWNEEDILLPPSSEVPSKPELEEGRKPQDRGCFGLLTFILVLFFMQGLSSVLGANYQLPHEFQLCEDRLKQEQVKAARDIPEAEIIQHMKEAGVSEEHSLAKAKLASGWSALGGKSDGGSLQSNGPDRLMVGKFEQTRNAILKDLKGQPVATFLSPNLPGSMQVETRRRLLGHTPVSGVEMLRVLSELESGIDDVANETKTLLDANSTERSNTTASGGANASQASAAVKDDKPQLPPELGEEEETLENAFVRLKNASAIIALLAFLSIVFGLLWILLLGKFTSAFLYLTLSTLPSALFCVGVVCVLVGTHVGWGILCFALSIGSIFLFWLLKNRIEFTAALLKFASQCMLQNWSLFFVALVLSIVQVLWLGGCFFFIGLSFLSGEAVRVFETKEGKTIVDTGVPSVEPSGVAHCEWQTDGWAYVGMGFIVFILIWVNNVINEMKRYTIAGTISLWYYMDEGKDNERRELQYPAFYSLKWSCVHSFGSLCFSALVSPFCELMKVMFRPHDHSPGMRRTDSDLTIQESVWYCLEDIIGFVNRFAIPLSAYSGYPFCHAAKSTMLLIHRNNLDEIVSDSSPFWTLRIGALVLALCSAVAGWLLSNAYVAWAVVDAGEFKVVHWIVARFVFIASFCISFLVFNFFASMLLDAMDILFLLYAMDRDRKSVCKKGRELHDLLASQHIGRPIVSGRYTPRGWNFIGSARDALGQRASWSDALNKSGTPRASLRTENTFGTAARTPLSPAIEAQDSPQDND